MWWGPPGGKERGELCSRLCPGDVARVVIVHNSVLWIHIFVSMYAIFMFLYVILIKMLFLKFFPVDFVHSMFDPPLQAAMYAIPC